MRYMVGLPRQSSSFIARTTFPRADSFSFGATASSRSRKKRSVLRDGPFSIIFPLEAGTARTERETLTPCSLPVQKRLDGLTAEGGVEDLHRVRHGHALAHPLEAGLNLKHATGVGGDDHARPGVEDVLGLAVAELGCGLRLDHVVDAGGAAAELGLLYLPDLHAGDLLQRLTRLLAYPL